MKSTIRTGRGPAIGLGLRALRASTAALASYSYFNPSDKHANITLSDSNKVATGTNASSGNVRSVTSKTTGKWYVEFVVVTYIATTGFGFAKSTASLTTFLGGDINGWGIWGNYTGALRVYNNNAFTTYGSRTFANGEVFGLYIDLDAGKAWWSEAASVISGDPTAGTGAMATFTGGTAMFLCGSPFANTASVRVRTNPAEHSHSPVSGFTAGWPV